MHRWSEDDDLIVYCLCLGKKEHTLGIEPTELADILGMSYDSLNYKVANFKAIDGLGGLDHSTEQSKRVQKRYCAVSDSELRRVGVEAVGRALDKYSNGS